MSVPHGTVRVPGATLPMATAAGASPGGETEAVQRQRVGLQAA